MNRLQRLFAEKDSQILNIYFTAGFPKLEDTATIIQHLAEAGVDLIEVGIPYSDPLADGPTIQQSGQRAIENGMTLEVLFQQLAAVRAQIEVPLVLMGYFNQVMQYGEQKFIDACVAAKVDGLILPDLPVHEYETFYKTAIEAAGLKVSFLITPQTSEERIQQIDTLSDSFIYMVSNAAITGAKKDISDQQIAYFERINNLQLNNPRLIGFGISNHETFSTACQYARGAIIGSAFIRMLERSNDLEKDIHQFVRSIRLG
ncbi:MAG: tryptophan synthase subunit alpha [Bacteroidota bacterium]